LNVTARILPEASAISAASAHHATGLPVIRAARPIIQPVGLPLTATAQRQKPFFPDAMACRIVSYVMDQIFQAGSQESRA
jgi:hypothetical protein